MIDGAFALLERSLRIDSRNLQAHLCRAGLMAAIYCSLCFALSTQNKFGAPGLRFFYGIAYLDVAFITLLGLGYFSTSITEEKEEDTLGLMLMAGISPLGILIGKSFARLWQALLLVAAQYPFMLLAVTIGGVTSLQIRSVAMALLAYIIFLAGWGLLCSTLAPRSRTASAMMFAGLVVYLVLPLMSRAILWNISVGSVRSGISPQMSSFQVVLKSINDSCIFLRLGEIMTTGFGESPWSLQVYTNFALGVICAGLSWVLFGFATRSPTGEASSRGLVSRKRAFFRFNAGRPIWNAFVWKDFHFVSGGISFILLRIALYFGLCLVVFMWTQIFHSTSPTGQEVSLALMMLSLAVTIDAAMLLAQAMHDEIRGQTLATLLMLPTSSIRVVYSKFLGSLLGWLPGPLILLAATLGTDQGRENFKSILLNEHGGWCVLLLFVLIPHFAPLAAVYVRWGSVALAIGMTFGVYFAIILGLTSFGGPSDAFFSIASCIMVCICLGCHLGVLLRVQSLAAR